MPSTLDILLFGHDAALQRTRCDLLKRHGLGVDPVTNLVELKSCLAVKPYILLVLCHSLSGGERVAGISLATSFLPAVHLLALQEGASGTVDLPLAQVLYTSNGPEVFLSAVHTLVHSTDRPTRSAKRKVAMAQFEGTVKWFNDAKGYGVLGRNVAGVEVFPHGSAIQGAGYRLLKERDVVAFDVAEGEKGLLADQGHPLKQK